MAKQVAKGRFVIGRTQRTGYYIKHLGPKTSPKANEIVVNMAVEFDDRVFQKNFTVGAKVDIDPNDPIIQLMQMNQ